MLTYVRVAVGWFQSTVWDFKFHNTGHLSLANSNILFLKLMEGSRQDNFKPSITLS